MATTTDPKSMSRAEAARLDLYDLLDRIERTKGQGIAYALAASQIAATVKEYPKTGAILDPADLQAYQTSAAATVRLKQAPGQQTVELPADQVAALGGPSGVAQLVARAALNGDSPIDGAANATPIRKAGAAELDALVGGTPSAGRVGAFADGVMSGIADELEKQGQAEARYAAWLNGRGHMS